MKIGVLIPAHNEAKTLGGLVSSIRLKGFEVLVVDDGSTDGSGEIARREGAQVISYQRKNGKGYVLNKGFEYFIHHDYQGVIMMDADGQHAPEDIDLFVKAAQEHPVSVVVGNRMNDTKDMPFVRRQTNRLMSLLISSACGQRILDTQCGYRYIGVEVLRQIALTSTGFEIETEILMKASKRGVKVFDVPIKTIYRNEESHINPFRDTFRFLVYFLKELSSKS